MKDENVGQIASLFRDYRYDHNNPVGEANDKAVQTLLRGDAARAVTMLEKIEHEHPGFYFTAANLGTAYELSGNDGKALKWLLEGIRRNRESHMNTEWLHVRILEAKLKLQAQPDWLKANTITKVDLKCINESGYEVSTAQGNQNMDAVRSSLYEQLSVRMLLVKPKDAVVTQLLIELAHLEHILGFQESVIKILDLAVNYGAPEETVSELRRKANALLMGTFFARLKYKLQAYIIRFIVEGSFLGLFIILIWRIIRRFLKVQPDTTVQNHQDSASMN